MVYRCRSCAGQGQRNTQEAALAARRTVDHRPPPQLAQCASEGHGEDVHSLAERQSQRAPRRHDNRISPVAAAGIQQELRDAGRRHNRLVAARLYDVDTVAEQDTDRTTDQHFPPDRTSQRRVPHAARRPARGLRRQRSENMRIHRSSDLRPLPALPHPRRDQARRADDRGRAQRLEGRRLRSTHRSRRRTLRRPCQAQRQRTYQGGHKADLQG